ncbi:MAG: RagB/SusD family nutrient uptake outer membrane protein [Bacteroidia bacterium]|nr:RagB/SusD family nutrient uptake outer membrane protein [Bacteroidia bacterium]
MKKIFSISIIVVLMLFFTACDKLLDLQPYQSISEELSLESDANVKSVLKGAYAQFNDESIYLGCILRNAELLGAADECLWTGTYSGPRQIFNKQMNSANEDVSGQWTDSYQVVNITNNVLSALAIVNEADRDRVEGEALFLRSLMFFDLVRFYSQQYQTGSASTQLGVPLVLTPTRGVTDESYVSRNSVEEVYNQVIADLIKAASKLPEDNDVYASKGAANALLARVYLQKGDYAKARDAASIVIESGVYELMSTYADVFNNNDNTSEDIFATQITPQDLSSAMTEFFSTTQYGGRDGDIEILEGHLNLYSPGDERYDLFWLGNGGMRSGKWNNLYGVVNLFRLAEMYLIRAECNQRLGTTIGDTPVNDYNAIHTRAKLTAVTTVTLADILLERRLELSFEGHRIHDQRRLHQNVGTLLYSDPKLVFPIPFRETEANPNLKTQQNPGY